jgi:hypothetical protein
MSGVLAGGRSLLEKIAVRASPAWVAFSCSLVLSLISVYGDTLNRDGMLYVDTARIFIEDGFKGATSTFNWPFLPMLMAVVSQASGLSLEVSGYLISALFMAGACGFLVASASRMFPEAVWPICLVVLALPGFNEYRDELLREYGCWFFLMLSFWLALHWADVPRWPMALAVQISLVMAALFRPEALAFFSTLILWQTFSAPTGERWRRVLQIGGLPLLGLATLVALYVTGNLGSGRLAGELGRMSPERFNAKALAMAPALIEYARDQVRTILFFGSLAIIPVKFIVKMGIFIAPLAYAFSGHTVRTTLGRNPLFVWAFLAHLLVLAVFVLDLQFLAGRYAGLLIAFAAPLTGYGLWRLMKRFPRWTIPMVALSLLVMIGNVVTLAPAKLHHVEAGAWLAKNIKEESPRIYIESPRAAYYAGWRFSARPSSKNRSNLELDLTQNKYDLVVLEVSRKEPDIEPWLRSHGLHKVTGFLHPNGDAVIIARPGTGDGQARPLSTPDMREKTGSIE